MMSYLKSYGYLLAILVYFLLCFDAVGAEVQRIELLNPRGIAAVELFSDLCRKIREEKYGNVHLVLDEKVTSRNKVQMVYAMEIEFWSHGNRYFRVDTAVTQSNNPKHKAGTRRRMIFSPHGSITLQSDSAKESFTIRRWEQDAKKNLAQMLGMRWFQAAGRTVSGVEADMIARGLAGLEVEDGDFREYLKLCKLLDFELTNDESRLKLKWQEQSDSTSRVFFAECDIEQGVVLKSELKGFDSKSLPQGTIDGVKQYQFDRFGSIPMSHVQKYLSADGEVEHIFKTKLVDWTPVPLGVFSFEAQGLTSLAPESVWSRRLWVILCGLALFVIVYFVKRVRSRARE